MLALGKLTRRAKAGTLFVPGRSQRCVGESFPYDADSALLSPDVVRQGRFAHRKHPKAPPCAWAARQCEQLPLFARSPARFGFVLATFLLFGQVAIHTCLPVAAKGVIVRNIRRVKGFVVLQKMDQDPVRLVGGVDGGLDLTLAALDGIEKGVAKVGAVKGQVVAEEIERIAKEGIALFGHLAVDDHIAADVNGRRHTGFSPHLVGKEDVIDIAHTGQVTGN
jgi:hypothetical protein